jgi:hypothetical protein
VTPYTALVFLHVLGAGGMVAAFGMERAALARLRGAASADEARAATAQLAAPSRLGPAAMIATLASGLVLMRMGWGPMAWLVGAVLALLAMIAVGAALSVRARRRLRAAPHAAAAAPLATSLRVRAALAVAIVGLMTLKPGLVGTALLLGASGLAAAGIAALPSWRRAPHRASEEAS